jgi:hypothetical protein
LSGSNRQSEQSAAADGGICIVSQLYELKVLIEEKIKANHLDAAEIKGQIGLKSGRLLAFINANTPDDPAVVAKLRQAIKDVLKVSA